MLQNNHATYIALVARGSQQLLIMPGAVQTWYGSSPKKRYFLIVVLFRFGFVTTLFICLQEKSRIFHCCFPSSTSLFMGEGGVVPIVAWLAQKGVLNMSRGQYRKCSCGRFFALAKILGKGENPLVQWGPEAAACWMIIWMTACFEHTW